MGRQVAFFVFFFFSHAVHQTSLVRRERDNMGSIRPVMSARGKRAHRDAAAPVGEPARHIRKRSDSPQSAARETRLNSHTKREGDSCGLLDLPLEVVLFPITHCVKDGRGVESLGATCRFLYNMVRDDHLWRDLFDRHFGSLYAFGTPAIPWSHARPTDAWPAQVSPFWAGVLVSLGKHESAGIGPACPRDPRIPEPSVRMSSAGRDWRWLYRPWLPARGMGKEIARVPHASQCHSARGTCKGRPTRRPPLWATYPVMECVMDVASKSTRPSQTVLSDGSKQCGSTTILQVGARLSTTSCPCPRSRCRADASSR